MTVGDRIKIAREKREWSQDDLAKVMGYSSRQAISKAECYGDNITTTKVKKYADALGVSFDYLMGWDDNSLVINVESKAKDDASILLQYHQLSAANQEVLKATLSALLDSQSKSQ